MYATAFETTSPLPPILGQSPFASPNRRRRIGPFPLSSAGIERFNQLLARLGRVRPLERDQLATAARTLTAPAGAATPPCILLRLRQADAVARMMADPDWQPANEVLSPAAAMLDYLRDHEPLIPAWVPRVGRLDDAIVIDTAWPRLAPEVANHRDFQRLRQLEAQLRGRRWQDLAFDRADWEQARQAEAALLIQQRRVRESSYAPPAVDYFRVH